MSVVSVDVYIGEEVTAPMYKFMYKKYVDEFKAGRKIRVGTRYDYAGADTPDRRTLLNVGKEDFHPGGGIDDPFEASTITHIGNARTSLSEDNDRLQSWRDQGFPLNLPAGAQIRNATFIQTLQNFFLFCASKDMSEETIEKMQRDSAKFNETSAPYDAIVPIIDINKFSKQLVVAAWSPGTTHFDVGVKNVTYDAKICTLEDRVIPPPNPFQKFSSFAKQSECRIIINQFIPPTTKSRVIQIQDADEVFGETIYL